MHARSHAHTPVLLLMVCLHFCVRLSYLVPELKNIVITWMGGGRGKEKMEGKKGRGLSFILGKPRTGLSDCSAFLTITKCLLRTTALVGHHLKTCTTSCYVPSWMSLTVSFLLHLAWHPDFSMTSQPSVPLLSSPSLLCSALLLKRTPLFHFGACAHFPFLSLGWSFSSYSYDWIPCF